MRFFALVAATAVCSLLTAAAPTAGNESIVGTGTVGSNYTNTQSAQSAAKSETITVELGKNGINVGDSKTLYNDAINAIDSLCPRPGEGCSKNQAKIIVYVTSRGLNPYTTTHVRKKITISVEDAYWGGRDQVYEVMRNSIAASFERGTYDPGNCAPPLTITIGGKKQFFRDCMTPDYAKVVLSGFYKMTVHFGGPRSDFKDLNYDCQRVVDDVFVFVRDDVDWKGVPWVYCTGDNLWPGKMT